MMRILSINKVIEHDTLSITNISESTLSTQPNIDEYNYIIINGGDGTIRRVVKTLHNLTHNASIILNPTGSFNVIAKLHRVPKLDYVLKNLSEGNKPSTKKQNYYSLNDEIFLFSAGNMGDLHHIFLSETLRFGILKKGISKYILVFIFLLPMHLIMTPFMLMSKRKFFIFTPASFISKFGSFYGKVKKINIDLDNHYNHIELDGDIVTIEQSVLEIKSAGRIEIVI
jgi:diacylglycerol kinase family enzyme